VQPLSVDGRPLAGRTFRTNGGAAAAVASFVLADLGARVVEVAPDAAADFGSGATAHTVVLSPYGSAGRLAGGPDHDSAVEGIGGAMMAQWTYAPGPAYLVTPYATTGQGLLAVAALLSRCLLAAAAPLPISGIHGIFAIQAGAYAYGAGQDPDRWRHTPRGQTPTYSTYLAADDWIFVGASTLPFTIKVLQLTELDEVLADPRAYAGPQPFQGTTLEQELRERITAIIRGRTRQEWLARFRSAGVPAGPVLALEEALAHPQLAAAGLIEPGAPTGMLTRLTQVEQHGDAAPRLPGSRGPLPLSGLRVVELAGYIAGSYAGRLLADLGADVVKIEPPDGDPFRRMGFGFAAWNHGKRSLALDLRSAAGRERLLSLVGGADILITNYRPEALDRMGVGREALFAVNPALLHCTISAFGETGPLALLPGFDPVVQGFAGLQKRQGGEGEPVKSQIAATDYLSGMLATIGVLAARLSQQEYGGGQVVRTSLLAAALLLNDGAYAALRQGKPYLTGGRDYPGPGPLNSMHAVRGGWLLTVAPDAAPDGRIATALRYLAEGVREETLDQAIDRLQSFGVPAVPCIDPEALTAEPHFTENGTWLTVEQPDLGPVTFPAPVLGPSLNTDAAPSAGEHNAVEQLWHEG